MAFERIGIIGRAPRRAVPQLERYAVPQTDVSRPGDQLTTQDGHQDVRTHRHAENGDEYGECVAAGFRCGPGPDQPDRNPQEEEPSLPWQNPHARTSPGPQTFPQPAPGWAPQHPR